MALIAETCCRSLLIDKVVFISDLHLFYVLVYLNTMVMPSLKKIQKKHYCISIATTFMQTSHNVMRYAHCLSCLFLSPDVGN